MVDSFSDVELDRDEISLSEPGLTWFPILKDLFETARRTALGSEKIITEILSELGDDDPPF